MENAKTVIMVVSMLGAAIGISYLSSLNPVTNGLMLGALFAIAGAGVANLILLLLYEIYKWYGRLSPASEPTQNTQPSASPTQESSFNMDFQF